MRHRQNVGRTAFLLTGRSAEDPIEGNLLSEAIVGQQNLSGEDGDEWIAGTKADRVKEIARALQEIDFETYLERFDRSAFSRNRIYPDIWEYEEEEAEIKEDLQISFETLKAFYEKWQHGEAPFWYPSIDATVAAAGAKRKSAGKAAGQNARPIFSFARIRRQIENDSLLFTGVAISCTI